MFTNVKAEMKRRGYTLSDLAQIWNCTVSTASLKLNGKTIVTVQEALDVRNWLGVEVPIEELFEPNN